MRLFKVLGRDGSACHGGHGKWSLPDGDMPGEWMPRIKDPEPCERGYHLCRRGDLLNWLGPTIYEAEARGRIVVGGDKVVCEAARLLRRMNWDDRVARLFAADCAERATKYWTAPEGVTWHPRQTIAVVRRYAVGRATDEELAAARDAAWAASSAAARAAAWAVEREAQTRLLVSYLEMT